nr:hypothetical protein [Tanacetum cinerariifolium]
MQTQTSNTLHNVIMEASSEDRPPMLAPGNYIQWKSRIKRYIDTKPNRELIHFCLTNPPYELGWKDKFIIDVEGNPTTATHQVFETYQNVEQEIRNQLNAEAEAVQIILTRIDNDIYSTVDACPNAYEIWKAIERLKQGESINVQDLETNLFWEFGKFTSLDGESLESYYLRFYKLMNDLTRNKCKPEWQRFVTLVKQSQELKHVSYHKLYDILKQHQHEVNEIRAEKIARVANPLALVAQQQQDNSPRIHRNVGYEGQRSGTVARARDTVGSSMVQKFRIQCYNCKEYGHIARECQKPKRAKDAAYHREKMLLCKQEEAGIQLNAEQADWRDDTDDESDDQELEAHYMYMAKLQQVSPDDDESGPIFDTEPQQKVQNDDHYDVFAIDCQHSEQSEPVHNTYLIEQDAQNVSLESVDINYDSEQIDQNDEDIDLAKEQANNKLSVENDQLYADYKKSKAELQRRNSVEYASEMELNCAKAKELKDKLSAQKDTISIFKQQKDAQIKLYKTREDKEIEKVIDLENKVK